jgi:hypothetical protein
MIVIRPFSRRCAIVSVPRPAGFSKGCGERTAARTGAGQVFVPDAGRAIRVECPARTLGRDVDMPAGREGRSRDEEEVLARDPGEDEVRDLVVEHDHGAGSAGRLGRT